MLLTNKAPLKDIQQAASLQVWHFHQMLQTHDFTPFQRAYFLKEVASAALIIADEIAEQNHFGSPPTPAPTPIPAPMVPSAQKGHRAKRTVI